MANSSIEAIKKLFAADVADADAAIEWIASHGDGQLGHKLLSKAEKMFRINPEATETLFIRRIEAGLPALGDDLAESLTVYGAPSSSPPLIRAYPPSGLRIPEDPNIGWALRMNRWILSVVSTIEDRADYVINIPTEGKTVANYRQRFHDALHRDSMLDARHNIRIVVLLRPDAEHFFLRELTCSMHLYGPAIQDLNKVIKLKPKSALAYAWRGRLRMEDSRCKEERDDSALDDLSDAICMDSTFKSAVR